METLLVDSIFIWNSDPKTGVLVESKIIPIKGTKYSFRIDNPRGEAGPGNQRHIHIIYKNNELFALNADKTAHDGCHGVKIPDDLVGFLQTKGFSVPSNHIIEMKMDANQMGLLLEEETSTKHILPIQGNFESILQKLMNIYEESHEFVIGIADYYTCSHLPNWGSVSILYQSNNLQDTRIVYNILSEAIKEWPANRGAVDNVRSTQWQFPYSVYVLWR